jgi:hypothetical protein
MTTVPVETIARRWYPTRPDVLLRLEALAELVVICVAYQHLNPGKWGMFALFFLAPDVSLLGYALPNKRVAAAFYNVLHCSVLPLALGLFAWAYTRPLAGELALIWLAHISFDRLVGYGLKFPSEFKRTHIQTSALG